MEEGCVQDKQTLLSPFVPPSVTVSFSLSVCVCGVFVCERSEGWGREWESRLKVAKGKTPESSCQGRKDLNQSGWQSWRSDHLRNGPQDGQLPANRKVQLSIISQVLFLFVCFCL